MELAKLESGDEVDLKIHLGGVGMLQTEKLKRTALTSMLSHGKIRACTKQAAKSN